MTELIMPSIDGRIDYESQILAGLVPSSDQLTDEDVVHLNECLTFLIEKVDLIFLKPSNRSLIQCMQVCREDTDGKGFLTEELLVDIMVREGVPPEKQVQYQELFHSYSKIYVSTGKFRYAVSRFLREKEEESYKKILNDSFTIQTSGMRVGKRELKGYRDARSYMNEKLFVLDQASGDNEVIEGDIRDEAEESVLEYEERQNEPAKFEGVKTGLAPIDDLTNGAQPGELWIIGGYTEVGKTFCIINGAHYAATKQGHDIVIGTSEVLYNQFRRRMYLRHARDPKFGLPYGISADAFKRGTLSPQELKAYKDAMRDFKTNPAYGRVRLFEIPRGADLAYVANKLNSINDMWKGIGRRIKGIYIDSIHWLLQGDEKNFRIHANQVVKNSKQLARHLRAPVFSPWHANRSSWEKAKEKGSYDLNSWMEADELERAADCLIWLLKLDNAQESREIQGGICKYRDGRNLKQFTLYQDFDASYLGSVASGQSVPSMGPQTSHGTVTSTATTTHVSRADGLY